MSFKSRMLAASVVTAGLLSPAAFAQVTGKVLLDGQAPERAQINMAANAQCAALHANPVLEETVVTGDNGELANAVVSIKAEGLKGDAPKEPVKLDQKGCQYHPHVVAMVAGQTLQVINDDPFLHNIHGFPFDNQAFNFAQPNVDRAGKPVNTIKVPERFSVKCDVHPWMLAHINVFDHPYFAVTNDKGEFSIPTKGLADGQYQLVIWQEKWGEQEGPPVEVKGGKAELAEPFKYKQQQAAAPANNLPTLTVRLASADKAAALAAAKDAKASSDACDHECCAADEKKAPAATAKKDETKKSESKPQQAKAD
jgi:hypothetical protein